jgi:alpha-L-rhamnosidase
MQETLLGVVLEASGVDGTVRASVRPPSAGLQRAAGSVPTAAGPLHLSWQRRHGGMTLDVTVPANAQALVTVAAGTPSSLRESGRPPDQVPGVSSVTPGPGSVVVGVGSGTYHFTSS